jgi:hypothetical protein
MVLSVPRRLRRSSLPLPVLYIKLSVLKIRIRMGLRTVIWLSRFRIQCCVLITSVGHQCKEDSDYVKTSIFKVKRFSFQLVYMTIQKHIPYDIKYDSRNRGEMNLRFSLTLKLSPSSLQGPLNNFLQYCYRFFLMAS